MHGLYMLQLHSSAKTVENLAGICRLCTHTRQVSNESGNVCIISAYISLKSVYSR